MREERVTPGPAIRSLLVGQGSLAQRLILSMAIAIPASYGVSGNWTTCIIVLAAQVGVHTGRGHAEDYKHMSEATIEQNLAQGFLVGIATLIGVCAISFLAGISLSFRYYFQFNVKAFSSEGIGAFISFVRAVRIYLIVFPILAIAAFIIDRSPSKTVLAVGQAYVAGPLWTLFTFVILMGIGAFIGKVFGSIFTPAIMALTDSGPYIRVMLRSVLGLFVGYSIVVLWFWGAYLLVLRVDSHSWSQTSSTSIGTSSPTTMGSLLYFSATTISTLGYSDIRPSSPVSQTLASLEAIAGIAWWVIVFAAINAHLSPLFSAISRQSNDKTMQLDTRILADLLDERQAILEELKCLRQQLDEMS